LHSRRPKANGKGGRRRSHLAALARPFVFALALLLATTAVNPARAASQLAFPRPAALEPNINFWLDVFSGYSERDFVILDRDQVWKIYQVLHLPGDGTPSPTDVEWANSYLKLKWGEVLHRLAAGAEPVGPQERIAAKLFAGEPPSAYEAAAQNLRVQQGLREQFRAAILRSRNYSSTMERIFRTAGLPVELTMLPHVESGFNNSSRSSAGAVGIWQFTRSTGKQYDLKITRRMDQRLDPFRETEAAAKLLRYNYEVLGSWPLAITAFNYGTYGMTRAAETCTSDFGSILRRFNGPHFGFASKNYYAEFLAALQIHSYESAYFPGIADDPTPPPQVVKVMLPAPSRSHARHGAKRIASATHRTHHKRHQAQTVRKTKSQTPPA
jgi:membrane-bound lytic murein transglycosylase D